MDYFENSVVAILDLLPRFAPAAIQDGIGRGNPRRGRGILRPHDADKDPERGPGVTARERTDFSDSSAICAHENSSHTAIAIRPANESDIKNAVMPASSSG
jgi:hypothetical protein